MGTCARLLGFLILTHGAVFGAGLAGIWMGDAPGRNGEKQDVAFQFKQVNGAWSGVMFGDEADLPVESLKVDGGQISFSITTTNYYSGNRLTMVYTGTLSDKEIRLTREPKDPPVNPVPAPRPNSKQTVVLKRLT